MVRTGRPRKEVAPKTDKRKKTANLLDPVDINQTVATKCCDSKCLIKNITVDFLTQQRQIFASKRQTEQKQYLVDLMRFNNGPNINGQPFCVVGYCSLFLLSNDRYQSVYKMWKNNIFKVTRKTNLPTPTISVCEIINAIQDWKALNCNVMPNNVNFETPIGFTRRMLLNQINAKTHKHISESHLSKILSKNFNEVKFPSIQKFTKCSECVQLRDKRDSTLNQDERSLYNSQLTAHYVVQRNERLYYAHKIYLALTQPDTYTSIAIDGMDQFKTRLPKFVNMWKDFDRNLQLVTHITGVKMHGYGTYSYIDLNQVIFSLSFFSFFFFFARQ